MMNSPYWRQWFPRPDKHLYASLAQALRQATLPIHGLDGGGGLPDNLPCRHPDATRSQAAGPTCQRRAALHRQPGPLRRRLICLAEPGSDGCRDDQPDRTTPTCQYREVGLFLRWRPEAYQRSWIWLLASCSEEARSDRL